MKNQMYYQPDGLETFQLQTKGKTRQNKIVKYELIYISKLHICICSMFNRFKCAFNVLSSISHYIKAKKGVTETKIPLLSSNDLIYVSGEIIYEKIPNDEERKMAKAHILARKILQFQTNHPHDSDDSMKGISFVFLLYFHEMDFNTIKNLNWQIV